MAVPFLTTEMWRSAVSDGRERHARPASKRRLNGCATKVTASGLFTPMTFPVSALSVRIGRVGIAIDLKVAAKLSPPPLRGAPLRC